MSDERASLNPEPAAPKKLRFGCMQVLGIVLIAVVATALFAGWWVKRYLYASPYKPTTLSAEDQKILEDKLERLDVAPGESRSQRSPAARPERYREDDSQREIRISEKELNALIANHEDAARRVAVDLADDLVSVNLVLPLDPDFPVLGGKTLRFKFGLTLTVTDERADVTIRGVSLGGIPLPAAWWGDIKNKNLAQEFSGAGGFWDRFSRGVERIEVADGALLIQLKE